MPRALLALTLLLTAAAPSVAQPGLSQYEVKAALLYNFLRYVEWPTRPASDEILLCVVGLERVAKMVQQTVKAQTIDGRPITVEVIQEPQPHCHLVFAPLGVRTDLYAKPPRGTVTVSEVPGFLKAGGVINFLIVDGRVRFEINPDAAEGAGVRLSSRLLRLRYVAAEGDGR